MKDINCNKPNICYKQKISHISNSGVITICDKN